MADKGKHIDCKNQKRVETKEIIILEDEGNNSEGKSHNTPIHNLPSI